MSKWREIEGKKKRGRPKLTWGNKVEDMRTKGWRREEAIGRARNKFGKKMQQKKKKIVNICMI